MFYLNIIITPSKIVFNAFFNMLQIVSYRGEPD